MVSGLEREVLTLRKLAGGDGTTEEEISEATSVEELLVMRMKRTEVRLLQEQEGATTLREQISTLNTQLGKAEAKLQERDGHIKQLEEDIRIEQRGHAATPTKAGEGGNAGDPMVDVLVRQRDRANAKQKEAEAQVVVAQEGTSKAKAALEALRVDNMKLFEKIRYLETYGTRKLEEGDKEVRSPGRGDETGMSRRYENMYESTINPWKQFQQNEKARGKAGMGKSEKVAHWLNTTLLAGRMGRIFFLVYLAAMHALVFFTVTYMQHQWSACRSITHKKAIGAHIFEEAARIASEASGATPMY